MKNANLKKVSPFSEIDSKNVPWHKDPILKYAWRIPLIILVPFFLFLSRHTIGSIFGYLSDHIITILVWLIVVPVAVITAIVVAVIVIKRGNDGLWAFFCVLGVATLPIFVLRARSRISYRKCY